MTSTTSRRAILAGATALPAVFAVPATTLALVQPDGPIVTWLARYQGSIDAFHATVRSASFTPEHEAAEAAMYDTLRAFLAADPKAASAADALAALDFALADEIFDGREEYGCERLVWQLIRAARDHLAAGKAVQS